MAEEEGSEPEGSVTNWITSLQGDAASAASRALWERYFERLSQLARARLGTAPRGPADEEDVALSVLDSFFRGAAAGRYPDLKNREDLWRLLITITARKAYNRWRDETRQKRGGGRTVTAAVLAGAEPDGDDVLAQVISADLTPEAASILTDEYRRLFGSLGDKSLRVVALMKLEGYSNEEIAQGLDCGVRTVERKLDVIRKRWLAEGSP
jgi:DNA-directed RNA polymerase specialized sigma24 family protein